MIRNSRIHLCLLAFCCFMLHGGEVAQRQAYRKLLKTDRELAMSQGLVSKDPVIRCRAIIEYYQSKGAQALPRLAAMVSESDSRAANALLACAIDARKKYQSSELLKKLADQCRDPGTRSNANCLATFNFYRNTRRLKDDPTQDFDIITLKSLQLPLKNWKFCKDPGGEAHKQNWFQPDFNDSGWRNMNIGYWEHQGIKQYDGIAWYRVTFDMPEKMECDAVELHFPAVDESAWVWLNGIYVGQHDIGPDGWNVPFWIDVTKDIRWGGKNQLTVRVEDTRFGGGIWKPVSAEILKCKRD